MWVEECCKDAHEQTDSGSEEKSRGRQNERWFVSQVDVLKTHKDKCVLFLALPCQSHYCTPTCLLHSHAFQCKEMTVLVRTCTQRMGREQFILFVSPSLSHLCSNVMQYFVVGSAFNSVSGCTVYSFLKLFFYHITAVLFSFAHCVVFFPLFIFIPLPRQCCEVKFLPKLLVTL